MAGSQFSGLPIEVGFLFSQPFDIRQYTSLKAEPDFQNAQLIIQDNNFVKFETTQQEVIQGKPKNQVWIMPYDRKYNKQTF